MYSAFAAWGYFKFPSSRKSSREVGGRGRQWEAPDHPQAVLPQNWGHRFWQPVLCEVNDAQDYLQTEGLNIHQWAQKIRALETVLEAKREAFVDDALIYAKSLCGGLEISFEPQKLIRRKHTFGDGSKDVQLSYEDDLRQTMFSSIDRVTVEIRERF
ncbi:uncharacterized protein TNCV_115311 [Trichonephila clavipes]|nr:uncharacterized protein TNCV_115311 [Trichonephila clavipes]